MDFRALFICTLILLAKFVVLYLRIAMLPILYSYVCLHSLCPLFDAAIYAFVNDLAYTPLLTCFRFITKSRDLGSPGFLSSFYEYGHTVFH